MGTRSTIIRVRFFDAPLHDQPTKTEFYFGSLTAIYEVFSPKQVGCRVETLWNADIDFGKPYRNRLCEVSKEKLVRKPQKRRLTE